MSSLNVQNSFSDVQNFFSHIQNSFFNIQNFFTHVRNFLSDVQNLFSHVQNFLSDIENFFSHVQNNSSDIENLFSHVHILPLSPHCTTFRAVATGRGCVVCRALIIAQVDFSDDVVFIIAHIEIPIVKVIF